MHPDLEKLIELILTDGNITEKERNVIIKKAKELGEDIDEIEVVLDARLHQHQSALFKPTKQRKGNINVCPVCGELVKAMEIKCSACDHEFVNIEAITSISILLSEITEIKRNAEIIDYTTEQRIAGLINSTPIPNSKEDLLEFLAVCCAQADVDFAARGTGVIPAAWANKGNEAFLKARIAFRGDNSSLSLLHEFETKLKSAKRKSKLIWLILILSLSLLAAIAFLA